MTLMGPHRPLSGYWMPKNRTRDTGAGLGPDRERLAFSERRPVSKSGQGFLLGVLDVEELIEPRDGKDLVNLGLQIAKPHLAGVRFDLLIEDNQLVEGGRREEFDAGEVQEQ